MQLPRRAAALYCCCALCFAISALRDTVAATYYWDTNGSTSGVGSASGAAANWLTNSWATSSTGTLPTSPWPNTQPNNADEAVFSGTSGVVNLDTNVYANSLTFQSNAYVLASTGGALHLEGTNPTINVNLPGGNNTATISAPLYGEQGFTLSGNSLSGGLKFVHLDNTDPANPNAFSGTLTINAGGALRLRGGVANEQIPDDVDLTVFGVIDFHTSGGASDGKQEHVRNVAVSGSVANFSVGNEADFIVNSITAVSNGAGQGIALNGNTANSPNDPGRLIINGWADGAGHLTLDDGRIRINTTSSSFGVGGRVLLTGNIFSSGNSEIWNHNGGPVTPEDHVFTHKALDFTSEAHTIDVSSGTLRMTSRAAIQPLDVTSTFPGGTTLTKSGAGVWLYEHAIQTSFTGTNRIEQGTLRLGASERLANSSRLEVAGGTFEMQSFSERVGDVLLENGLIAASGSGTLTSNSFEAREGIAQARLGGAADFVKTTAGTVQLDGVNSYSGRTHVTDGMLLVNGTHVGGGAFTVDTGAALGGSGSITAPVSINGSLAPGTNIGTLTVQGNVDFGVGANLAIDLDGASSDRLVVHGDLDLSALDQTLEVYGAGTGGSWVIATYGGTLTGGFETVSPGYTVNYGTGNNSEITLYEAAFLVGDYNDDGIVDAADYTVWRNNLGGLGSSLENRDPAIGSGPVGAADYSSWKSRYGRTAPGVGSLTQYITVPEPTSSPMLVSGIALILFVLPFTRGNSSADRLGLSTSDCPAMNRTQSNLQPTAQRDFCPARARRRLG